MLARLHFNENYFEKEIVDSVVEKLSELFASGDVDSKMILVNLDKYTIENDRANISAFNVDLSSIQKIEDKRTEIKRNINEFRQSITNEKLELLVKDLSEEYSNDFIELINDKKILERIDDSTFSAVLRLNKFGLATLISKNVIVKNFNDVIKTYLKTNPMTVKLFRNSNFQSKFNFTGTELDSITEKYLSTKNTDYQVLDRLGKNKKLSAAVRHKVKEAKAKEEEKMFGSVENMAREYSLKIEISPEISEEDGFGTGDSTDLVNIRYSYHWLADNVDYATILQNFVSLFPFVDKQSRSRAVTRHSEDSVFRAIIYHDELDYRTNQPAMIRQSLINISVQIYYKLLEEMAIHLEDVIQWFFEDYVFEEFEVSNFQVNFNNEDDIPMYTKNLLLYSQFDRVLKMYEHYQREGEVNLGYMNLDSNVPDLSRLRSLNGNKYGYAEQGLRNILSILFGNQTIMMKATDCWFDELIDQKKLSLSRFYEFSVPRFEELKKLGLINIEDDMVILVNLPLAILLKELYQNDVINLQFMENSKYGKLFVDELEMLIRKEYLVLEDTLFTRQEVKYMNYVMNTKGGIVNGLELRNKYMHGSANWHEEQNFVDYTLGLQMVFLFIIKFNDDLCIRDMSARGELYY